MKTIKNMKPLIYFVWGIQVFVVLSLWIVHQSYIFNPIVISVDDIRCHG